MFRFSLRLFLAFLKSFEISCSDWLVDSFRLADVIAEITINAPVLKKFPPCFETRFKKFSIFNSPPFSVLYNKNDDY